ncbi:9148ef91-e691-4353-a6cc-3910924ca651 [Sclerotinia trifoliorum]|uniref:9148ef91-e691-4353-a6cc-3910924ca651 n=1 Tax=Sclerotinia trifoliorum TaxID=28548 RepID=A0A8H2VLE3_9HELO|nr:9148ef91-e691-4353-a6cc-3910924ca651 [Sclerotinia trifoliorum]
MAKESRMVVLQYSKEKRETIENIINMESVLAQQVVNHGLNIGESASEPKLPIHQSSKIEEALSQIRRVLRNFNCERAIAECLLLAGEALRSLRDPSVAKEGVQISDDQHQSLVKNNGVTETVKPMPIIEHWRKEDFRSRISELTEANQKLSDANIVFEKKNNELISEVDAKEIELSALKDELKRMRENESQLKNVEENLEASRDTTDKALKVFSSLKEKDSRYRDGSLKLKDELETCQAERKEIIKDSKHQNEAWERKHAELFERNEYLKGKITGFKRKLGDVMEDIDNGTPSKKRQGAKLVIDITG